MKTAEELSEELILHLDSAKAIAWTVANVLENGHTTHEENVFSALALRGAEILLARADDLLDLVNNAPE